jgi:hypothetical protein
MQNRSAFPVYPYPVVYSDTRRAAVVLSFVTRRTRRWSSAASHREWISLRALLLKTTASTSMVVARHSQSLS